MSTAVFYQENELGKPLMITPNDGQHLLLIIATQGIKTSTAHLCQEEVDISQAK